MIYDVIKGIFIPLFGTALGSAMVFFINGEMKPSLKKSLTGFAAGVMIAASIWSLIIPAIELSQGSVFFKVFPTLCGHWLGAVFLIFSDSFAEKIITKNQLDNSIKGTSMLVFAVALHNLPEGMAVGVIYAGLMSGNGAVTLAAALALSVGIAIQNFPEGAIVSMPLASLGMSRKKAFLTGAISGIVEPIGAIITIWAASIISSALPYFLSFAAGAMIYVVICELVPEFQKKNISYVGIITFFLGFSVMMTLDVLLG